MTYFKPKVAFISTLLLTFGQHAATDMSSDHERIASLENTETEADGSCDDECELNSIGMASRNFVTDPKRKWENATVPYRISDFDTPEIQTIIDAMYYIQAVSCVKFVANPTGDQGTLDIGKGEGCSASHFGKSTHLQFLNIKTCINNQFRVIHELMHILGIGHEHTRSDRDNYITINWENILDGKKHNFDKVDNVSFTTFDFPYDYDSVMHYSPKAFSKNGKDTITPLMNVENYKLGQRNHLSKYDVLRLNALYDCYKDKGC